MRTLIAAAMDRSRTTLLAFLFLLMGGMIAYQVIPKESSPDIAIPVIYVAMTLDGISPEDAERLLVRPMEQELRSLEGIKEMRGNASEGHASVMLEFDAGFDADKALQDVREKVDTARSKLPQEADEPRVHEINISLFPVLSIGLSGPLSERELITIARRFQDAIEAVPEVLEVDIGGDREDLLEIVVDPQVLESYGIDFNQLASMVSRNNRLVAAGSLDTGSGRMSLKVPGVIESIEDVMSMPIKVDGDTVVTFGDVAMLQRTFKDPTGFARINNEPALVLEVSKRSGANIIATIEKVRSLVEQVKPQLPDALEIRYIMDQSEEVRDILSDLLNNVLTAIVLVLVVVIAAMGARSALLVGLTIPGAFLTGILVIWSM
ncbi:MAG: efflux RND transporter permease subunit, partial [Marinobacter sp.]